MKLSRTLPWIAAVVALGFFELRSNWLDILDHLVWPGALVIVGGIVAMLLAGVVIQFAIGAVLWVPLKLLAMFSSKPTERPGLPPLPRHRGACEAGSVSSRG